MGDWNMGIPDCVPEYFREQEEKYERECALEHGRQEHYKANRIKRKEAKEAGYPVLDYGGYDACAGCGYADFDTACFEDDDFCSVICKNPACAEHGKHQTGSN